jgi:hypothetical protein
MINQLELAPSVGYLNASLLKFGELVGGDHNATNRTILASPWNDRPAQPLNLAILTRKDVAIRCDNLSGEAALMCLLPSLRNLREDVVVRATDDLMPVEVVLLALRSAYCEVTHGSVEECGQSRGRRDLRNQFSLDRA